MESTLVQPKPSNSLRLILLPSTPAHPPSPVPASSHTCVPACTHTHTMRTENLCTLACSSLSTILLLRMMPSITTAGFEPKSWMIQAVLGWAVMDGTIDR